MNHRVCCWYLSLLWTLRVFKMYKVNPHTKRGLRNSRLNISTISGEEIQIIQRSSAVALSAFGQEGNIIIICCSTGEFLLHFGNIIAYLSLASFTDRQPLSVRRNTSRTSGGRWSVKQGKKKHTYVLYKDSAYFTSCQISHVDQLLEQNYTT
jgi:hypothetical protein